MKKLSWIGPRIDAALLLPVLLLCAPMASAADLRCSGLDTADRNVAVLRIEKGTLKAAVMTKHGLAEGELQETLDLHLGTLKAADGVMYWISLHRYTGRMSYGLESPGKGETGRPEFLGDCK